MVRIVVVVSGLLKSMDVVTRPSLNFDAAVAAAVVPVAAAHAAVALAGVVVAPAVAAPAVVAAAAVHIDEEAEAEVEVIAGGPPRNDVTILDGDDQVTLETSPVTTCDGSFLKVDSLLLSWGRRVSCLFADSRMVSRLIMRFINKAMDSTELSSWYTADCGSDR